MFTILASLLLPVTGDPDARAEPLIGYYGAAVYSAPYCANGGVCVPPMYCSVHYGDLVYEATSTSCWLAINTHGICCYPTVPNVGKVIGNHQIFSMYQSQFLDRTSAASRESSRFQVSDRV